MNLNNDRNDIDSSLTEHEPHCASEKLFRKLKAEKNNLLKKSNSKSSRLSNKLSNVNEKSEPNLKKLKHSDVSWQSDNHESKPDVVKRFKRWLPDEEVRLPNTR